MVILDIYGGLGNQMFQFATGLSLSMQLKTELVFSTSSFKNDKLRSFSLDQFKINNRQITFDVSSASTLRKIFYRLPLNMKVFNEKEEFVYDNSLFFVEGNCFVRGYWQNELYFRDMRSDLLNYFNLRKLSKDFLFIKSRIIAKLSVSIHIRRGDFVSNLTISQKHNVCNMKYYWQAINLLSTLLDSREFNLYVFSDDIDWCKQHLKEVRNVYFVQGLSDAEELLLMSECHHNITANSKFSWWAAWLNSYSKKIVITPQIWLKNTDLKYEQFIPESWIKL